MNNAIQHYLTRTRARCEHAETVSERFALPALTLLMQSNAYGRGDWSALAELAADLREENLVTIRVATRHSDVFHENVARSRRAENRVYETVIRMVGESRALKAA